MNTQTAPPPKVWHQHLLTVRATESRYRQECSWFQEVSAKQEKNTKYVLQMYYTPTHPHSACQSAPLKGALSYLKQLRGKLWIVYSCASHLTQAMYIVCLDQFKRNVWINYFVWFHTGPYERLSAHTYHWIDNKTIVQLVWYMYMYYIHALWDRLNQLFLSLNLIRLSCLPRQNIYFRTKHFPTHICLPFPHSLTLHSIISQTILLLK